MSQKKARPQNLHLKVKIVQKSGSKMSLHELMYMVEEELRLRQIEVVTIAGALK